MKNPRFFLKMELARALLKKKKKQVGLTHGYINETENAKFSF